MIRTTSYTTSKIARSALLDPWCRILQFTIVAAFVVVIHISCTSEEKAPVFLPDRGESKDSGDSGFSRQADADGAQDEPDTSMLLDCLDRETLVDQVVFYEDSRFEDLNRYSLIEEQLSFGLVYQGEGCDQAINFVSVASTGPSDPPLSIDPIPTDDCTNATDPIITHTEAGWIAVWFDNDNDRRGLFYRRLEVDTESVFIEQTENYLTSVSAAPGLDDTVIAWISDKDGTRAIQAKHLGKPDEQITIISDPERYPEKAALHRLYDGFALVWLDTSEANKGLYLVVLNLNLSLIGTITRVTPYVDGQSTFDLLTDDFGHTLLYATAMGPSREIRFRRFDESGEWSDKERYIVDKPDHARDASLDVYGKMGYIVAYRSAPDAIADSWTIRTSFVTRDGRRVGETQVVAESAPASGRVTIRTSADGMIMVAWVDATAFQKRLRLVRMRTGCNM